MRATFRGGSWATHRARLLELVKVGVGHPAAGDGVVHVGPALGIVQVVPCPLHPSALAYSGAAGRTATTPIITSPSLRTCTVSSRNNCGRQHVAARAAASTHRGGLGLVVGGSSGGTVVHGAGLRGRGAWAADSRQQQQNARAAARDGGRGGGRGCRR